MGQPYQRASDGAWVVALELPSEGTKRRRKVIVRAKKSDVILAAREARKELDRTGNLVTASPMLSGWLDGWIDRRAKAKLKPRTAQDYRSTIELYLKPSIGRVRLAKLTPGHVEKMHDYVMHDLGLASTTALKAHRVLAKALTDAERAGKVPRNVATLVDAPTKAYNPRKALSAPEAVVLLRSVGDGPLAARVGVALLAGLRQGEALGLTRDAIDLEAGTVTVSWQLQRLAWEHGCGDVPCGKRAAFCPERTVTIPPDQEAERVHGGLWLTRPKSRTGWREVPIAAGLDVELARHLARFPLGPHGLIFTDTTKAGRVVPVDPSRDAVAWDKACADAGVPDVPLHGARHTTATLLAVLGVPEDVRMQILGHSSATVTRGYTHRTTQDARAGMAALGGLLLPATPEG
jgi:integrase